MPTQIQIKRGSSSPSGLTQGEFALNTSTNQVWIGGTAGSIWVGGEVTGGVDMGAGSAASQNRVPTQSGVYNYVRNNFVTSLNGLSGSITLNAGTNVTITSSVAGGITIAASGGGGSSGVSSFNGLTGDVTGTSVARHWFI